MNEVVRCPWSVGSAEYRQYHDTEWGRPLYGQDELFERMCLEAFQAGLSWITVRRKRPAFRSAFDDFRVTAVADFGPADLSRLLADPGIVRNRAKIEACVHNARLIVADGIDLNEVLWSFAPTVRKPRPHSIAEIPAVTTESTAMAKDLKRRGLKFIGPTTAYALMQAVGMVDDHVADCFVRIARSGH